MKNLLFISAAGLLSVFGNQAHAHLQQTNLGTLANHGDVLTAGPTYLSGYAWLEGTQNSLADSHGLPMIYQFSLSQAIQVQISANALYDANPQASPAFSLYAGFLPAAAHDDASYDPMTAGNLTYRFNASPVDKRPDDPLIRHYLRVPDSSGNLSWIENPIWNTPDANLGGLSPAQWYEANYHSHNGYRDTLNLTQIGGQQLVAVNGVTGLYPANYDPVSKTGPLQGFHGQFDTFGSWSMANSANEWAKAEYVSSISYTPCQGPNCVSTDTGGFINPGHFAGNQGLSESMILTLAAGDYTVILDDESCGKNVTVSCMGGGTATLEVRAVPIPGAATLFMTGLIGSWRMKSRSNREWI